MSALLAVRELEASHGAHRVLQGVDIDVTAGEICAVMGVSGAGKTTVLRTIAALQPFSGGSIVVDGFPLQAGALLPESKLKELRRRVGVVFQSHALFEHLSVLENITLAPQHALKWTPERASEVARRLLRELGVEACIDAYPRALSGGEAQRVAIARALACDPRLLLMDEPTSALDPARRMSLGALLRDLAAQGRGLLIVTHDVDFARACADRVVILKQGIIAEQGVAEQVLDNPTHSATCELLEGNRKKPE